MIGWLLWLLSSLLLVLLHLLIAASMNLLVVGGLTFCLRRLPRHRSVDDEW